MPQAARKRGTATKAAARSQRRRGPANGAGAAKAKPAAAAAKSAARKPTEAAKSVAEKAAPKRLARKLLLKAIAKSVRTAAGGAARMAGGAARTLRSVDLVPLLSRARTLPIQRSLDIAVPLEVAWEEWVELGFIPEGTHRVAAVEREGDDRMFGHVKGMHVEREWVAEILDEREGESFAWHSVSGSDCSGLVTFHPLGARLTRVELHLDVIPGGVSAAVELVTRVADRRAQAELRRFKAHVETLDPDEYPTEED